MESSIYIEREQLQLDILVNNLVSQKAANQFHINMVAIYVQT